MDTNSLDSWYDLQGNSVSDFLKAYRESLKAQRDSNQKSLEQQRRNAQRSLMAGANRRGMLYSNFVDRSKRKYDVDTYYPNAVKIQSSYTTGLDNLRKNAINLWNTIKSYQEQVNDYQEGIV